MQADVDAQWRAGRAPAAIERDCRERYGVTSNCVRRYLARSRKALAALLSVQSPDEIKAQVDALMGEAADMARTQQRPDLLLQAAQRRGELHGVFKRELNVSATISGVADLLATAFDDASNTAAKPQQSARTEGASPLGE